MTTGELQTKEPTTAVYMEDRELEMYRDYIRHYSKFEELLRNKAFDLKNGHITIHFLEGVIMDIETNHKIYKRMMRK